MKIPPRLKSGLFLCILLVALAFSALLAYRLTSGRSLGLRSYLGSRVYAVQSVLKSLANRQLVSDLSTGKFTNVVFLHHSVGSNLIDQGGVRQLMAQAGYNFWDHGYNFQGLRDPEGKTTGYSYNIPGDNTDPDGLAMLFRQPVYSLPLNAFSSLLQHEVIIFKSCFPANNIASEDQLSQYQTWYLGMRDVMDRHPDKIFIVMTPPPLNPAETNREAAARAQLFAGWLTSPEFLGDHPNIFTFDLFNLLAEDDPHAPDAGMLRSDYRTGSDSHPNRLANEAIGSVFVEFIRDSIQSFNQANNR